MSKVKSKSQSVAVVKSRAMDRYQTVVLGIEHASGQQDQIEEQLVEEEECASDWERVADVTGSEEQKSSSSTVQTKRTVSVQTMEKRTGTDAASSSR